MDFSIRLMKPEERDFAYTQKPEILENSGCIGHLRVDLGSTGQNFYSNWDDHRADLKTPEFKAEFDEVVNALREDANTGCFLKDRDALRKFCHQFPESKINEDGREFGFRLDTDDYAYMLRLNPNRGEYAAYIYAYDRELLDFYLIPEQEMDQDAFVQTEDYEAPTEKITVLIVEPETVPYVKEIDHTLGNLQSEVSGDIEAIYPFEDRVALICNEDGKMIPLAPNRALYDQSGRLYDIIAGTFMVAGIGESNFCSLTDDQIKKFSERFHAPEAFVNIGGRIHVLKLKDDHVQKQSVMDKLKKPTVKEALTQKKKAQEEVR